MKRRIRIGSRESVLAVAQSRLLIENIKEHFPDVECELVTMKTTGDRILDRPLDAEGGKGLFVKELDSALLSGKVDLTVHSLKDVPMEISDDLPLVAFSAREDPRDALIVRGGADELGPGDLIGSSSRRRALQLADLFPGCVTASVRGNVMTRLTKLDRGDFSAIVLAAAGLRRLGLEGRITRFFSVGEMIPAAGQGIIAVQGRRGEQHPYLSAFADAASETAALCERAFVRRLDGGCTSPVCAHATVSGGMIHLKGLYYNEETDGHITGEISGDASDSESLGYELADRLVRDGGLV